MAIHVALHHLSRYRYDRPVGHSPHTVRLRPAPHCRTPILGYSLKVRPVNTLVHWQQDPFSNYNARLVFTDPRISEFVVEVELVAAMEGLNPFDFFLEQNAELFPFAYEPDLARDLVPFLELGEITPEFRKYSDALPRRSQRTIEWLTGLNQRLCQDIVYGVRLEPGVRTPEETLSQRAGSCRDSAWLMVQLLRHHGLAARFVSGYLIQLKPEVLPEGERGVEADSAALHAWCEVYLPGAGWIGLDPTSGLLAAESHLPLACTREPASAAPITGTAEPSHSEFEHTMTLTRLQEPPSGAKREDSPSRLSASH